MCYGSDEKFHDKILAELSRLEDKTSKLVEETEELKVKMAEKDRRIEMLEDKLAAKDQEKADIRQHKR